MAHYEMKWNGNMYEVFKDGARIDGNISYFAIFNRLLAEADDTDTFSDYKGGDPRWTMQQVRAWAAKRKARFGKGTK